MEPKIIKRFVFIVMLLNFTIIYSVPLQNLTIQDQPTRAPRMGPCADPPCNGEQAPENPIDNGLSYLLMAGVAFGIYELRRKKKTIVNV